MIVPSQLDALRGWRASAGPETWASRGYDYPKDRAIDELIFVPPKAEYYAAFGAVMYGVQEPGQVGSWKGLDALRAFIASGRKAKLGDAAGPPLSRSDNELEAFRKAG